MKKYTQPFTPESEVTVPVLHRVYYASEDENEVRDWLNENCQDRYYTSPGWSGYYIEFEDDIDAEMFNLRWS